MGNGHVGRALRGVHFMAVRLYLASAVAGVIFLSCLALGNTDIAGLVHQSIGALITAGCIWFISFALQVATAERMGQLRDENTPASLSPAALTPPGD